MSSGFGIYVHTPWCRSRCPYCAFNVYLSHTADYPRWQECILAAWSSIKPRFHGRAHSLYFGGGTPSLAPPEAIGALIEAMPLQPDAEITLEANPGTIGPDGLAAMRSVGINRLSIGVQTFNQAHARTLGRGHTIKQARQLLQAADEFGFSSWSMDLMFSLPDQTEEELRQDLDELLQFEPPHVSIYGLSIEPSTPFYTAFHTGKFDLPNPDSWRRMYDNIVDQLQQAGLHRYEVSNFARTGHRAVHNERVWRGGHYAGLGPGAHGFLPDGHRTMGHAGIDEWYADPNPVEQRPARQDAAIDYLLSSLRHVEGSSRTKLREYFGFELCQSNVRQLVEQEYIVEHGDHVQLTQTGFPLADGILRSIVDNLEPAHHT